MPELPKKITVDLQAQRLLIDGDEIPYYIADQPTLPGPNDLAAVNVSIYAETIEVVTNDGELVTVSEQVADIRSTPPIVFQNRRDLLEQEVVRAEQELADANDRLAKCDADV